jgi:hypothetical protein
LIVRMDGLVEISFLDRECGTLIGGAFRGVDWQACLERLAPRENVPATDLARVLGWEGEGMLRGDAFFFGGLANPDVPGKVLAAAVRMWDVVLN